MLIDDSTERKLSYDSLSNKNFKKFNFYLKFITLLKFNQSFLFIIAFIVL